MRFFLFIAILLGNSVFAEDLNIHLIRTQIHKEFFVEELAQPSEENLVLFTLGPGGVPEQTLPPYFLRLASDLPGCRAKIFVLDQVSLPRNDHPKFKFLYDGGWEEVKKRDPYSPVRFVKGNVEIIFFKFTIPEDSSDFEQVLEKYIVKILDRGGCLFAGHHGTAYWAFAPFANVYNKTLATHSKGNNYQMYLSCGATNTKVYDKTPYSKEEADKEFSLMSDWHAWRLSPEGEGWDGLTWEEQQVIIETYLKGFEPSYKICRDLSHLDYKLKSTAKGQYIIEGVVLQKGV